MRIEGFSSSFLLVLHTALSGGEGVQETSCMHRGVTRKGKGGGVAAFAIPGATAVFLRIMSFSFFFFIPVKYLFLVHLSTCVMGASFVVLSWGSGPVGC